MPTVEMPTRSYDLGDLAGNEFEHDGECPGLLQQFRVLDEPLSVVGRLARTR